MQIRLAERLGSMLNLSRNIHPAIARLILARSVANNRREGTQEVPAIPIGRCNAQMRGQMAERGRSWIRLDTIENEG